MQPLHALMNAILKSHDNWKMKLMTEWESIIGAMSQHICLEKIAENATLVVGVHDTKWMQELHYLSHELVDLINRGLGGTYVTTIRFVLSRRLKVSHKAPRKKTQVSRASRATVYTRRTLTHTQLQALQHITDGELQNVLRDLMQLSA